MVTPVARTKAFVKEEALRRAIPVFWEKGFAATSTEDLVQAMGIGRQSLYDTFGDKRALYLEALRTYNHDSVSAITRNLRTGSPLQALEAVLVDLADEKPSRRKLGCLGVNAICELGQRDDAVREISQGSTAFLESALLEVIERGQALGEIDASVDPRSAMRFLATTLNGLKVNARAGASPQSLREVAVFAVRSLRSS